MPISAQALEILIAYGFPKNLSKRALKSTGGSSVDLALNWIDENRTDPTIDMPVDVDIIDMSFDDGP